MFSTANILILLLLKYFTDVTYLYWKYSHPDETATLWRLKWTCHDRNVQAADPVLFLKILIAWLLEWFFSYNIFWVTDLQQVDQENQVKVLIGIGSTETREGLRDSGATSTLRRSCQINRRSRCRARRKWREGKEDGKQRGSKKRRVRRREAKKEWKELVGEWKEGRQWKKKKRWIERKKSWGH